MERTFFRWKMVVRGSVGWQTLKKSLNYGEIERSTRLLLLNTKEEFSDDHGVRSQSSGIKLFLSLKRRYREM